MLIDKMNNFINNDKIPDDIKQFVLDLLELLCVTEISDDETSKHLFIDLGFFDINENEIIDKDDFYIIDFQQLLKIDKKIRKIIYSGIINDIKTEESISIFSEILLDMDIVIKYAEWEKKSRKHKLNKLKNDL